MDIPTQPPLALERAVANGLQVEHGGWHRRVSFVRSTPLRSSQPKVRAPRRSVGRRRVQLEVVPVGVLERRDLAPRMLGDLAGELDALALQLLDRGIDVIDREGDDRAAVAGR